MFDWWNLEPTIFGRLTGQLPRFFLVKFDVRLGSHALRKQILGGGTVQSLLAVAAGVPIPFRCAARWNSWQKGWKEKRGGPKPDGNKTLYHHFRHAMVILEACPKFRHSHGLLAKDGRCSSPAIQLASSLLATRVFLTLAAAPSVLKGSNGEREREREIRRTSRDGFNYCCLKHLKTINQQSGSGNHSSHGQPWWFGCGHVNPSEFHSDFTTWLHNGWCSDEGNHPRPWPYDDFFQVTTHCYHLGRFFMCVFCIPIYFIQTFTIDSP